MIIISRIAVVAKMVHRYLVLALIFLISQDLMPIFSIATYGMFIIGFVALSIACEID